MDREVFFDELDAMVLSDDFGVNHKINAILEKQGLFAEWENTGVLGVAEM